MELTEDFKNMINDENINLSQELREYLLKDILKVKSIYTSIQNYKGVPKYIKLFYLADGQKVKVGTIFKVDKDEKISHIFVKLFKLNRAMNQQENIKEKLKSEYNYNSIEKNIKEITLTLIEKDIFIRLSTLLKHIEKISTIHRAVNEIDKIIKKDIEKFSFCQIVKEGRKNVTEVNLKEYEEFFLFVIEYFKEKEQTKTLNKIKNIMKLNYQLELELLN